MPPAFTRSRRSFKTKGKPIAGAEDRQQRIKGFDQEVYSEASVCCIGAGGLISHIAPTLVRKGIGGITLFDRDVVEVSNLNRQRFYANDVGKYKALALARNLKQECISDTLIRAYAYTFQETISNGFNINCDVAVCGVDNNPTRIAVSKYFSARRIPIVFTGVSADGDHGYVFIQRQQGACISCLFPDMADDDRYPCPGTPAISDILQAVGSAATYAVDTLLMPRPICWNYCRVSLSGNGGDGKANVMVRASCTVTDHGYKARVVPAS